MSATAIPVHPCRKGCWQETEGNNFSAKARMSGWLTSASVGTAPGRDEQRVWQDEFHKDEKMKPILELVSKLYLTAELVNDPEESPRERAGSRGVVQEADAGGRSPPMETPPVRPRLNEPRGGALRDRAFKQN